MPPSQSIPKRSRRWFRARIAWLMKVIWITRIFIKLDRSLTPVWDIWGTGKKAGTSQLMSKPKYTKSMDQKMLKVLFPPNPIKLPIKPVLSLKMTSHLYPLIPKTMSNPKINSSKTYPKTKNCNHNKMRTSNNNKLTNHLKKCKKAQSNSSKLN